jgi:hypothetical protein
VDWRRGAAAALPTDTTTRPGPQGRSTAGWRSAPTLELHRLARTLNSWREELLARFHSGAISNGPNEAVNLLIKKVNQVEYGFRNFTNYRLRLLLHGCRTRRPAADRMLSRHPAAVDRAGDDGVASSPTASPPTASG